MKLKFAVFTTLLLVVFTLAPVTDLFYVMNFGSAGCMALGVRLRFDDGPKSLVAAVATAFIILAIPHP